MVSQYVEQREGGIAALLFWLALMPLTATAQQSDSMEKSITAAGVSGGLCVMVGTGDAESAAALARSGRYLVHLLDPDAAAIEAARDALHKAGLYGLASVDQLSGEGRLPYAENLVNVVVLCGAGVPPAIKNAGETPAAKNAGETPAPQCAKVRLAEVARVLCPGGILLATEKLPEDELASAGLDPVQTAEGTPWRCARKTRPKEMDSWTHPRHAADGNAVSRDLLAGPPRRVRWIAGPQQEISNMVTADGRCFFAGVLARDAFNGLRLWDQKLTPSPARGGFNFTAIPGSVRPIAVGKTLLVVTDKRLRALDAATGKTVRDYPEAGVPTDLVVEAGTILAVDAGALCAVDFETGRLLWKQEANQARYVVAGDGAVYYVEGDPRREETVVLVSRELAGGKPRWRQKELPWLGKVRQCVYHGGLVACEISTLADEKKGNVLHVLSAADGAPLWNRMFVPGTTHKKQARAMFVGEMLWVLEEKRCVALDPRTGEEKKTRPAGGGHCFPPIATLNYLVAGEMDFTNLATGKVDANQITKAACSRDAGVVPANGLIYTFPKHCICWPMLRDYAALAPERSTGLDWQNLRFTPEAGPARPLLRTTAVEDPAAVWPSYRHDALRSGSTKEPVARELAVAWTAPLGDRPPGTIAEDWRQNYFIRNPVGPPVVARGLVYVTRPEAHQVVALDVQTGQVRWTFTANGRVDTAPTIHRGLCLFGSKSGWVYCLRADTGGLVWRLRAAPVDERIVAYGQLESPWPVPGSVLATDDAVYFAAGRHPLADGGILVFSVEPTSGSVRWMQRLSTVPQTQFYGSSGLEFDNFDLLLLEGREVAMSRWLFDCATGKMTCAAKSGFVRLATGGSGVMFPRGAWSYAPVNETELWKERPFVRPLAVFRDNALYSCTQDRQTVFRRDFDLDNDEKFDVEWFAGWTTYKRAREGGDLWRPQRLARGAKWTAVPFEQPAGKQPVAAMVLAGDVLCVASSPGKPASPGQSPAPASLALVRTSDGRTIGQVEVPPPAWDGLAAAYGRLFLSTQDGRVVCLAGKE